MHDIITIGSATRDLFARASNIDVHPSAHAPSGKEACLPLGAKIDIQELNFDTGGGATNTAVSFAHFGMRTAALCRVGNDYAGEEIKRVLRHEGVDTHLIGTDPKIRTACSIALLTPTGERTILVYRGASGTFTTASLLWKKLQTSWLYISSLGGNTKLLAHILKWATRNHIRVAWNPGGKEISCGIKKLSLFIRQTDVFILNEEEAKTLTHTKDPTPLLCGLPRRALAITQSGRGALVADATQTLHAPALKVKTVNTTGAGDAFSAGFITGLWKWNDLSLALRLGILNSGMCVTKMGAKNGLLPRLPGTKQLARITVDKLKV